jgi:hypothetical protein
MISASRICGNKGQGQLVDGADTRVENMKVGRCIHPSGDVGLRGQSGIP